MIYFKYLFICDLEAFLYYVLMSRYYLIQAISSAKKPKIDYNIKRVFTDIVKQLVRGYYDFR